MTLYGDLNENGVTVFIDGDQVILETNDEKIELENTTENQNKLIEQAKELENQWAIDQNR
jgi:hypothetical protein